MPPAASRRSGPPPGQGAAAPQLRVLLLLFCCAGAGRGAPILSQGLRSEQELQLWNEMEGRRAMLLCLLPKKGEQRLKGFIGAACSSFLSIGSQSQASSALEELCFTIMGTLLKPQKTDEKVNTKRFLFHYSKTQKLGNSNVASSVVHPLLQLIPQLQERRMKRFKVAKAFQSPAARQRYFLFRPRNGKRSEGYI